MNGDKASNHSKSDDGQRLDEILRSFLERDYMENPTPSAWPHKDNGDKINKNGWPYSDVKLRCIFLPSMLRRFNQEKVYRGLSVIRQFQTLQRLV